MGIVIYNLYNSKKQSDDKISELNRVITNLNDEKNKISEDAELNNDSENATTNTAQNSTGKENNQKEQTTQVNATKNSSSAKENITLSSTYGKAITNYIQSIWAETVYKDCIAEFSNIKSAPKDYLAVCASRKTWNKAGDDIYSAKLKFSEFNSSLIELFGNEADGLITTSDIEKVFFVEKNSDGTYHFSGYDGSQIDGTDYIISKIEKFEQIHHWC